MSTSPNEPYVSAPPPAGETPGPEASGQNTRNGSPPVLSRASREQRGLGLIAVGAVLLFVSLFLNWYEPGRSAWTVFEVWDLVLAVLSVVALVGAAGRLGIVHRRPDSWLTGPAAASFLIVLVSLVNHPPAATGAAPMFGLWLALLATILMLIGVAISVARISVAINLHPHGAPPPVSGEPAARPTPSHRGHRFRHSRSPAPPPPVPADSPQPSTAATSAEQPTEVTRPQTEGPSKPSQAPPNSP